MGDSENISYLLPRDPSIKSWSDRVKLPGRVKENLVTLGLQAADGPETEKLKVYLRVKPCNVEENLYTVSENTLAVEAPKDNAAYKKLSKDVTKLVHKFHFSSVFKQDAPQERIFEKCVEDSLRRFLRGQNGLLFAYGTTNAGKTYTMQGTVENPGVIPRAIKFIFNCLEHKLEKFPQYQPCRYDDLCLLDDEELRKELVHKNFILNLDLVKYQRYPEVSYRSYRAETTKSSIEMSEVYENVTFREMESHLLNVKCDVTNAGYAVWISMIEIHNEQIYDLLEVPEEKDSRVKLGFAEDGNGKVYIKNMRYVNVISGHEAYQVFQFGKANLSLGPTALNNESSRSHCICTITIAKFFEDGSSNHAVLNRFSFCDLAGSERVKKALTHSSRLAESKSINTSLSIFHKCLNVIKENQTSREKKMVPYRESKLTRLFRDAMMGRQSFSIIVNITPEPHLFGETVNVLKVSAIAQQIVPTTMFTKKIDKRLMDNKKNKFVRAIAKRNDSGTESDDNTGTKKGRRNTETFEVLMNLTDRLKKELANERERANNIEVQIRQELSSKFMEMIKDHNEINRNIHESEIQKMQEGFDKKQKMIVEYYERQRQNSKKRRMEDDYSDYIQKRNKVKALEREIEILQSENDSLRDLIKQLNSDNDKLQLRCTELEYDLSVKERIVVSCMKTREASSPDGDEFVKELQNQLRDCKSKIAELQTLVDENNFEYKDLLVTNKSVREENDELVSALATTSVTVDELKNDLQEYQVMLSVKNKKIEELKNMLKERDENEGQHEYRDRVQELQGLLNEKEMQRMESVRELNQLKDEIIELRDCNNQIINENEDLKTLISKMKEFNGAVRIKSEVSDNPSYVECSEDIKISHDKIAMLKKDNEELQIKCDQQNEEIDILQKELKNLTRLVVDLNAKLENLNVEDGIKEKNEALLKEIDDYRKNNSDLEKMLEEERKNYEEAKRAHGIMMDEIQKKLEDAEKQITASAIPNEEPNRKAEENDWAIREKGYQEKLSMYEEDVANIIKEKESEINKLREENERLVRERSFVNETPEKIKLPKVNVEHKAVQTEKGISESKNGSECSSKEESPREIDESRRLSRKIEQLSLFNSEPKKSCKKVAAITDGTVHPSLIKSCGGRSRRKVKAELHINDQNEQEKLHKKCSKKLFTDNDFDDVGDLESSFTEPEIPRLRPRRKKNGAPVLGDH